MMKTKALIKRSFQKLCFIVISYIFVVSSLIQAFDVSSTTPTSSVTSAMKSKPIKISDKFIKNFLHNAKLSTNVELLLLTEDGNYIKSIRGSLGKVSDGDLSIAVKRYLLENSVLFNIPINKGDRVLFLNRSEDLTHGNYLEYQMILDGVKVYESYIGVSLDKKRNVLCVSGSFPTIEEFDNEIKIGRIQAILIAKKLVGAKKIVGTPKSELMIYPENGKGRMAYNVKFSSLEPLGDWELLIDAETGKEILRYNQMAYNTSANTTTTVQTGKGSVFPNHPLIQKEPEVVELKNLTSYSLKGLYADVRNDDFPNAIASDYIHIYPPENTHFDEVNIYYHINQIHSFFKKMGFNKLDSPIVAIVHYGNEYDNAFFSPFTNTLSFGDGKKFNNLAREESVCYHEYSHAMLSQIVRLNYSGESGAINEGQADYFACSLSNDDKIGEYVVAKLNKPYLRVLTHNLHYPEDIQGEVHADGRIWGGTLWDIRNELGKDIADVVIYNSFYYLKSGSPKFIDAANAIIVADKNIFGGANANRLNEVLKKRGIFNKSSYDGALFDKSDIIKMKNFYKIHKE